MVIGIDHLKMTGDEGVMTEDETIETEIVTEVGIEIVAEEIEIETDGIVTVIEKGTEVEIGIEIGSVIEIVTVIAVGTETEKRKNKVIRTSQLNKGVHLVLRILRKDHLYQAKLQQNQMHKLNNLYYHLVMVHLNPVTKQLWMHHHKCHVLQERVALTFQVCYLPLNKPRQAVLKLIPNPMKTMPARQMAHRQTNRQKC